MSIAKPLNLPFALAPVMQNDIIRVLGEYTFIRLDNGDEVFYHHGNWITGADANCVELPVPDDKEWSWDDVVTQLVRASFTRQVRGDRATSMSDLMKVSGLASASIYKQLYPDKRTIYLAALQQYMDEGASRAAERDAEFSPEMALRETLEFVALLSSSPVGEKGCFTIAAASELLPGDAEVKSKVHHKFNKKINQLEKILCRGQPQQLFRCDESPRTMAISIFMILEGMRFLGKFSPKLTNSKRVTNLLSDRCSQTDMKMGKASPDRHQHDGSGHNSSASKKKNYNGCTRM